MYRPDKQRQIKEKHYRELVAGKRVHRETLEQTVDRLALADMHKAVREAYLDGAGNYAFHLMLDLERVLADEKPVNRDFEARYRKLCRQ